MFKVKTGAAPSLAVRGTEVLLKTTFLTWLASCQAGCFFTLSATLLYMPFALYVFYSDCSFQKQSLFLEEHLPTAVYIAACCSPTRELCSRRSWGASLNCFPCSNRDSSIERKISPAIFTRMPDFLWIAESLQNKDKAVHGWNSPRFLQTSSHTSHNMHYALLIFTQPTFNWTLNSKME